MFKNKITKLITCCALVISPFHVISQQDDGLFDLSFEELLTVDISVASNVVTSASMQPASVTTISHSQIELSGARTLNELLSIFTPGYFLVEDQDDTIAGFRGLVPDNNSKVMLLLNGVNLNTEWFWGAPDAILNGLDMDFIERIEVIRGPGSVTLGQGALLGVINIITKDGRSQGSNVSAYQGLDGLNRYAMDVSYQSEEMKAYGYFSKGYYNGQSIENEGWAQAKIEQGLSVFERNHGLKKSDYTNFFGSIESNGFGINVFHFEQRRDLYNFFRDREAVGQTLDGIAAHYDYQINDDVKIKLSSH